MKNAEFKRAARNHQIKFREQEMKSEHGKYSTWLKKEDGSAGKNFYKGFGIFEEVEKRYPEFKLGLYSDTLRSEHIPFNLFIPFRTNLDFCKNVFNELMGGVIKSIDKKAIIDNSENIKIEFAPSPKENYLNDRTSFDAYIEYTHADDSKGIIGIEVKYTEREYPLKSGSTEAKTINDISSKYYSVSNDSKLYKENSFSVLKTDIFRQVWRNHLLAESIRLVHGEKFSHVSSLTFYPKDNDHFTHVSEQYVNLMNSNSNKFISVTYEKFLSSCISHCPNDNYKNWIDYLTKRYIITID